MDAQTTELTPETPPADLWTSTSSQPDGSLVTTEPDETPEPAPVEAVAAPSETPEKPKVGKPRNDPRARVEQATQQAAAAKEEARVAREETARYRAELEQATHRAAQPQSPTPPLVAPTKFPSFETWSEGNADATYDDYVDARADARAEAKIATWRAEQESARELDVLQSRMDEGARKYPDIQRVVQENNPPITPVMFKAMKASGQTADIVYWLATHPDQCTQLAARTNWPESAVSADAAEVMRLYLESQVAHGAALSPDSAPQARPSAALPPVNRVGGTATATPVDPDDVPFGPDFIRIENARERKKQEGRW